MSTTKQESLKIPVLNKVDYPTWKVKIILYFEAVDPDFIDRITDGPHVPKKLIPKEGTTPEHYVDKTREELTREERLEVLKDSKVKSILHNILDSLMSNRVIACKIYKQIWDTLEVQCQGTKAIKKNWRALLVQGYERYETNPDEDLTD